MNVGEPRRVVVAEPLVAPVPEDEEDDAAEPEPCEPLTTPT